jgi:hypothetical protein
MNQTEQKIMDIGNQYIIYMLTMNDEDKFIYSQLLEFEGGKLDHLIFYKLRNYLWNDDPYIEEKDKEDEDYDDDDEEDDEEDDGTRFVNSSTIEEFGLDMGIDFTDIFNNEEELIELKKKIGVWVEERNGIEPDLNKYSNVVEEYLYHFFSEYGNMGTNEVKEYIISLLDPCEPK